MATRLLLRAQSLQAKTWPVYVVRIHAISNSFPYGADNQSTMI
jgi:hypothetical protein